MLRGSLLEQEGILVTSDSIYKLLLIGRSQNAYQMHMVRDFIASTLVGVVSITCSLISLL
jgi:hypothetical protein